MLAEFFVGKPENHMENLGEDNTKMNIKKFDCAFSLICGNKMPTRCNKAFIADIIACKTCFGHHYAHHQELKSIIQWLLPVVFTAVNM